MLTLIFESASNETVLYHLSDKASGSKTNASETHVSKTNGSAINDSPLKRVALSELPSAVPTFYQHEITIVIPGEQVTTRLIDIPKGSKRHFKKALPFLLEDELATPVEELHFALAKPNNEDQVLCAIIEKQVLNNYLELLTDAGITASNLIPDYWLLAKDSQNQSSTKKFNNKLLVRSSNDTGITIPLALVRSNHTLPNNLLENLGFSIEQPHVEQIDQIPELQSINVNQAPLNILQAKYTPAIQQSNNSWIKSTVIAASICILIFMIYFLSAGWYFNQQARTMTTEAKTAYKELFPNETRIIDIRRQMAAHLNQDGNGVTDKLFFRLTGVVAEAIAGETNEQATIRHLRYEHKDGTLQLELQAKSMGYAHNLQSRLQEMGVVAEVLSANSNDEGAIARLKLSENK